MDICAVAAKHPTHPLLESHPFAALLCFTVERALSHGLDDWSLFGRTYFWSFVRHLGDCLPSTHSIIQSVSAATPSPCGRGRVFLRVLLNERAMAECLSALVWNTSLVAKHYRTTALVRREEDASIFLLLLENLNGVSFSLASVDPLLDDPDYWSKLQILQIPRRVVLQNSSIGQNSGVSL